MFKVTTINNCGKLIKQVTSLLFLSGLIALNFANAQQSPDLTTQTGNISNDGHIKLSWSLMESVDGYEIQQSTDPDFERSKIIYNGPDLATFISGLKNGTYYYRVRAKGSDWSNVITIHVRHHSLQLAFMLFALGGIVFLLTVFVVVKGTLQYSKNPI